MAGKAAKNVVTYVTMAILFIINLLNYIDRYTVVGVIPYLKDGSQNGFHRDISDTEVASLQTGFIISYMCFSPIFGYLGDRFIRKRIMGAGVILWSLFTAAGSFAPNYWFLLAMRSMVGVGEASYVTVAPTIIADLFSARSRIRALSIYYIAIPVGTAMGYGIGAYAAMLAKDVIPRNYTESHELMEPWRFSLRITPVLGILCALLILCILKEPPRGQSEGVDVKGISGFRAYYNDVKYCIKIPSYVLSTFGFAMGTFVIGGLAQWAPLFIYKTSHDTGHPYSNTLTNLLFGFITVVGGLGGTIVGSESSKRLHSRLGAAADCYVCAASLLLGSVFAYFALTLSRHLLILSWILVFIAVFSLCLCWAPVAAIVLNIIIPERRATAAGFQTFVSHLLGDAFSPLLIGFVRNMLCLLCNMKPWILVDITSHTNSFVVEMFNVEVKLLHLKHHLY